jgi:hypothetical protein
MAAKITAKKATAKRPSARPRPQIEAPPVSAVADPVEIPRLTTRTEPAERVPLFYIDDVEYSVTRSPGVNIGLKYLHLQRTQGEQNAIAFLLEKLLGSEGFLALLEYDDLTAEQFQEICRIASDLTVGALELPKD